MNLYQISSTISCKPFFLPDLNSTTMTASRNGDRHRVASPRRERGAHQRHPIQHTQSPGPQRIRPSTPPVSVSSSGRTHRDRLLAGQRHGQEPVRITRSAWHHSLGAHALHQEGWSRTTSSRTTTGASHGIICIELARQFPDINVVVQD